LVTRAHANITTRLDVPSRITTDLRASLVTYQG